MGGLTPFRMSQVKFPSRVFVVILTFISTEEAVVDVGMDQQLPPR